jgi:ABC-type tungstate transport system substrate-binding protein
MKYDAKFKAYCRRVVRNAEVAVTAKRKTRKGLDAIRTLGALALALTVLTPAAIAQDAPRNAGTDPAVLAEVGEGIIVGVYKLVRTEVITAPISRHPTWMGMNTKGGRAA